MKTTQPRVVFALHEAVPKGATIAALQCAELARDAGWDVSLWGPRNSATETLASKRGLRYHGAKRDFVYSLRSLNAGRRKARRLAAMALYLWRFFLHIRKERPDVVHVNTTLALPELIVTIASRQRSVFHVHEMLDQRMSHKVARFIAQKASHVFVPSRAAADRLGSRSRVSVLYHGVPMIPVEKHCIDDDVPVVGTLGTISHRKGSEVFVDMVQLLRQRGYEFEAKMIGPMAEGPELSWSEYQVTRAHSQGVLTGASSSAVEDLANWDIMVLPTRQDPFPLVVLEAMSVGTPVVTSRVDGTPEQVGTDGRSGVLVDSVCADSFANAVARLLVRPDLRSSIGFAGQQRVASTFSLAAQQASLVETYDRIRGPRR